MEFRLAKLEDLPKIQTMYKEIIEYMKTINNPIWDEDYPCKVFQYDIEKKQLFVLVDHETIVSAFALFEDSDANVEWKDKDSKAIYIERFGVNLKYARQGIGSLMLKKAKQYTKDQGIPYLRLYVVLTNQPAINHYRKNGFLQREGIYQLKIDEDFYIAEHGYEVEII